MVLELGLRDMRSLLQRILLSCGLLLLLLICGLLRTEIRYTENNRIKTPERDIPAIVVSNLAAVGLVEELETGCIESWQQLQ